MDRRTFGKKALATLTGAGIASSAGCTTGYNAMVENNIQEDIQGMNPEQAAEYFLNEQRDFDEVNGTSGLAADEVQVNYTENGDSYSAVITKEN